MKYSECSYEKDVLRAVQSRQWEETIQSHALTCPICQEIVQVSEWMQGLADVPEDEPALPSPGQIWWKAQWLEKRAAEEKATRPIVIFQNVAYTVAAVVLLSLSSWKWPQIQGWLTGLKLNWLQSLSLFGSGFTSLYLLSLGFGLFCIAVIIALYTVFVEE